MAIGNGCVDVSLGGDDDQCFPQAPAACSLPSLRIKPYPLTKRPRRRLIEERPGNDEVAGGIASAAGSEIDDGGKFSIPDEQITLGYIAMHPDWLADPMRSERRIPEGGDARHIEFAAQRLDRGPGFGVVDL